MARQTRQKAATSPSKSSKRAKPSAPTRSRTGASKPSPPRHGSRRVERGVTTAAKTAAVPASKAAGIRGQERAAQAAPAAARKPGYYEALAMYESGVRALQRHDYQGAAAQFRAIIERYPEERELQERSQLYLRVCERETARQPPTPQSPQERVYAATVALNAGDTAAALEHLRRALSDSPDSDHAHYIMAVALASKGESGQALEHLRRAISLNPENRSLARQDPDLETIRDIDEFRELLEAPAGSARSKARKKR
jgi:tetratricopeptide (TPR) repeat protein